MKIKNVFISNYRSYDVSGVSIPISDITGLIGPNSAGKSNVLKAIDIFFNPSKLESTDFCNENIDNPIIIEITFYDYKKTNIIEEFVLSNSDQITIRRIYKWNSDKQQGEAEKNLLPAYTWQYKGDEKILHPFTDKKNEKCEFDDFVKSDRYLDFKNTIGRDITKLSEINEAVTEYWCKKHKNASEWRKNYEWVKTEDIRDNINKDITKFVNNFSSQFPEYIYLSIEHGVLDEMALKKGTRLENMLTHIMKLSDEENDEKQKSEKNIKQIIEEHYKNFYDNKLELLNTHMSETNVSWEFAETKLKFERGQQEIEQILNPIPCLVADDGFSSKIETKGNGVQRLAIFQFLQAYSELIVKSKDLDIIFAIEEPELYLHPSYRRALYKLFRKLSATFQILYTTHDPMFVQLEYFDEIRIIRKNKSKKSYVNFVTWETIDKNGYGSKLFGKKRKAVSKRMELHNKCHGLQNEGFFAEKVILVEGNTEIYALPTYLEKFNFNLDMANISLISSGGVDALISMYIIFTLFEIPVYIIFDGDKPKNEMEYKIFSDIMDISIDKYEEFLEELNRFAENKSNESFENLMKINEKIKIVSKEWMESLSICDSDIVQERIDCSLIKIERFKELKNKRSRNEKIKSLFGMDGGVSFSGTEIQPWYTKWEYDFEECVSKEISNYNDLSAKAKENFSGKPLIAKFIADNVNFSDMNEPFTMMMEQIIEKIKSLNSENIYSLNAIKKTPRKNDEYRICLGTKRGRKKIDVYSCAAGPCNPMVDDPVEYAYGKVPDNTDYIIKINGDSMESDIPNGSYIAVKRVNECFNNKTYVFYHDGNSICKKYNCDKNGVIRLISTNKKYANIEIKEFTQVQCCGEVICKKNKKPYLLVVEDE